MSNISQVVVNLSSEHREALLAAGLDEVNFVRGLFNKAIDGLIEKQERAAKRTAPKREEEKAPTPITKSKQSGK